MRALTFVDDLPNVEVEIVKKYSGDLFEVLYEGRRLVRHKLRLKALDDETRALLRSGDDTGDET